MANGSVFSVAKEGNSIYLGGIFSAIAPATGGGTGLDLPTGNADGSFPRVDGNVRQVVSDGSGGWYIAGVFTAVGNVPRFNVAHIKADKSVDLAWNANLPASAGNEVLAIAYTGSAVYIGGFFQTVNGQTRNRIAALDPTTGNVTSWNPNAGNVVRGLAFFGTTIYAFGDFNTIGGQSRTFLAGLDASTGLATSWNPAPVPNVLGMTVSGSTLYVGGNFTTIGGQGRNRIAAIDLTTGLVTSWNPNANTAVRCIAVNGGIVYAGGAFSTIGGQTRNRIAALDISTGVATAWNPNAISSTGFPTVDAIATAGSNVYVGGLFSNIGGQDRNSIAALDATTGLATAWNPDAGQSISGTPTVVGTLVVDGSTVYAGGYFHCIGGVQRKNIGAIDATTGIATAWNPSVTGNMVRKIIVHGTTVYVGGQFNNIGGQTRNNIGAVDATTGVVTSWNPDASSQVYSLAMNGSSVLVGGAFTTIGGQTRNRIAALDPSTGSATAWNPDANSVVKSLAVDGSTVYAGGFFTTIGGQSRSGLAAVDASSGLASAWDPSPNFAPINDIEVSGPTVYVGGAFNAIGGQTRLYVAALNASTGLATTWNPNHTPAEVGALTVGTNAVHIIDNSGVIQAHDITNGLMLSWRRVANSGTLDIQRSGTEVFVGGSFSMVDGMSRQGFVRMADATSIGGSAPTITSFSPSAGSNGMLVAITGTNFHPTAADNIVSFNGRPAVVTSSTTTSISTLVPAGAVPGPITVTVNGLTATSSSFSVVAVGGSYPPCIFGSRVDLPHGVTTSDMAIGDLDGDGKPDMVITNSSTNNMSVYRNTSTLGDISASSFATPVTIFTGGGNPNSVKITDIDGDGKSEIVVVNTFNSICIFRNISTPGTLTTGSFAASVCLTTGQNPVDFDAGDVDGDGKPDLVVTNLISTFISAFRNLSTPGTIQFASRFDVSAFDGYSKIFLRDLDADGKRDVITMRGGLISVWRNTATSGVINSATFAARVDVDNTVNTVEFTVGDVDMDSKLDLILTSRNDPGIIQIKRNISTPGSITTGSFDAAVNFNAGVSNSSPQLADLNGDGKQDLIMVKTACPACIPPFQSVTSHLSVFVNISTPGVINTGSLQPRADFSLDANGGLVEAADIDGDGSPEAIILNTNTYSLMRNLTSVAATVTVNSFLPTSGNVGTTVTITGTNFDPVPSNNLVNFNGVYAVVTASTTTSITTTVPSLATTGAIEVIANCHAASLATFTIGSSGLPAIASFSPVSGAIGTSVTITGTSFSTTPATNIVYFGAVRATVTAATATQLTVTVPAGATYQPITVNVAGLTAISKKPFIVTFAGGGSINACTLAPRVDFPTGADSSPIASGDLDGDGKADIVTGNVASLAAGCPVSVLRNTSTGPGNVNFAAALDFVAGVSVRSVTLQDIDGDGRLDLIAANYYNNSVSIFRNTSTGPGNISFAGKEDLTTGSGPMTVIAGDFDMDGKMDLATANEAGNTVSILRNTGSGPGDIDFATKSDFAIGTNPWVIVPLDVDGDGRTDLAATLVGNNPIPVLRNTTSAPGAINFDSPVSFPAGISTYYIVAGDIDNDDKVDLTVGDFLISLAVLRNTSTGPGNLAYTAATPFTTATQPRSPALGDMDGDGRVDFLTGNTNSTISILRNSSSGVGNISADPRFNFAAGSSPFTVLPGDFDGDGKTDVANVNSANIVSIYRNTIGEGSVSITSLAPTGGPVGTTVSINGTGFSTTPASNVVSFNGTPATVSASTSTSITVTVPASASTGLITVQVGCNTASSPGNFSVCSTPSAPGVTSGAACGTATVLLQASGAAPGEYRWYSVATGGTPIAGATNAGYTTPSLSTTTTYYVSVLIASCESARTAVTATINPLPPAATVTASFGCLPSSSVVLTASGGLPGNYRWYTTPTGGTPIAGAVNATYTTPVLSSTTSYYVATYNGTCESTRTSAIAEIKSCAPQIAATSTKAPAGGTTTLNLSSLVTTVVSTLDVNSFSIVTPPLSGAKASILSGTLLIDYTGIAFTGTDRLTIRACDMMTNCGQQDITVEVAGNIVVYNAVSANGDGKNDILLIEFIDVIPDTKENKVTVFNRWGDLVFEAVNYDNKSSVFSGAGKSGDRLPAGTYYYKIEFASGRPTVTGFISLKQ